MTGDAVGFGQCGVLVDGAELDVVTGLGEHVGDRVGVERARVGEPGATTDDHADADALALRRHEVLDVALVHADLGLATAGDERLDLLAGARLLDDPVGDHLQLGFERSVSRSLAALAHELVPPIVSDLTRSVG